MKQFSVFHPFLFAIFPILFLFAYNIDEVPATDILLPLFITTIGTLVLLLSLRLITKNYNKIAIIASTFLVLFFSYGHVRELIFSHMAKSPFDISFFLLSMWALLFVAVTILVIKSRRDFSISTKFLNVVSIAVVAISLINIGIYEVRKFNLAPETASERLASLDLEDSHSLPDIYYIILDEYARQDTLNEFWHYDNSEFIDYLTAKGFYVASKSRSNYSHTCLSLPSSLNMEYINYLSGKVTRQDRTVLWEMVANSKASQFLKSNGYRYIFAGNESICKGIGKYAEMLEYTGAFGIKVSDFATALIQTTALAPFASYLGQQEEEMMEISHAFNRLADIPAIREPTFVFAYFMCPHPPFPIYRDWRQSPQELALQAHQVYLDRLIFITKKVETLIDELLSKSEVPPVIILQSDTGPHRHMQQPGAKLTEEIFMKERMKILNAYFLPNNGNQLLYESITPVNTFRIVFNLYFDTDYDLLEDKSYYGWFNELLPVPPEGNAIETIVPPGNINLPEEMWLFSPMKG